jgi:GDP-L-fucose synthase
MARQLTRITGKRVFVAGHAGMVGSALVRRLSTMGCELITAPHASVDLRRQAETEAFLHATRPELVFLAAARVGGILANSRYPADFLYDNLMMATNVMHAAFQVGVEKLLFLGSSCVYPKLAPQPIAEDALLSGPLEPTNQWYAIAKIAGIKLAQAYRLQHQCDFISVQPANLYGQGDNFDREASHVPAALLRRFEEAKRTGLREVIVWGTGTPRREFLQVDDLADACTFVMERYSDDEPLNVGTGSDITIAEFARLVAEVVGYRGRIVFDPSKPDGAPRKLLDVSQLTGLGWKASTTLRDGLRIYCASYLKRLLAGRVDRAFAADEGLKSSKRPKSSTRRPTSVSGVS